MIALAWCALLLALPILLRQRRRLLVLVVSSVVTVMSILNVVLVFRALWEDGTRAAERIKAGQPFASASFGGLRLLDLDALPFHFTKLPPRHTFHQACVLFLGRHDGWLALYDTEHDLPLSLPEDEYHGEVLGPTALGPPARCERVARREAGVLAVAERVRDVDAVGGDVTWTQLRRDARRWELMLRRHERFHLLTRSDEPAHPDFGRDWQGRRVLSYRVCQNGGCRVRELLRRGIERDFPTPPLGPCRPDRPVRDLHLVAVVLAGRHCPTTVRGIWTHRRSGAWTRVPTSGSATGDVDLYGSRLTWVEHRGALVRVRELTSERSARTVYEEAAGLKGLRVAVGSVHLDRSGTWFSTAIGDDGAVLHRAPRETSCSYGPRFQVGSEVVPQIAFGLDGFWVAGNSELRVQRSPSAVGGKLPGTELDPARGCRR